MFIADWNALGDVLYRKWNVYDMGWGEKVKIEDFLICGAPFGGPLAMIRDDRKKSEDDLTPPKLWIYTSSGIKIAEVDWNNKRVAGMGWSDQEYLVTVLEDGNVLLYDIHGKLVRNFLLLDLSTTSHVLECHFWGNGVVCITSDMQIFVAEVIISIIYYIIVFYSTNIYLFYIHRDYLHPILLLYLVNINLEQV